MELTTLQDYVAQAKREYDEKQKKFEEKYGFPSEIPFEDEGLVYAILDWHSMKGEFTQEELDWLREEYDFEDYDIEFLVNND